MDAFYILISRSEVLISKILCLYWTLFYDIVDNTLWIVWATMWKIGKGAVRVLQYIFWMNFEFEYLNESPTIPSYFCQSAILLWPGTDSWSKTFSCFSGFQVILFSFADFWQQDVKLCTVKFFRLSFVDIFVNETFPQKEVRYVALCSNLGLWFILRIKSPKHAATS